MTEAEKRERRALERKLSEMEEELKVSIDFLISVFSSAFSIADRFRLNGKCVCARADTVVEDIYSLL